MTIIIYGKYGKCAFPSGRPCVYKLCSLYKLQPLHLIFTKCCHGYDDRPAVKGGGLFLSLSLSFSLTITTSPLLLSLITVYFH